MGGGEGGRFAPAPSTSSSSSSDMAKKTLLIPGSVLEEALSREESESDARSAVKRAMEKRCGRSRYLEKRLR